MMVRRLQTSWASAASQAGTGGCEVTRRRLVRLRETPHKILRSCPA
jgi:hypothetical protein